MAGTDMVRLDMVRRIVRRTTDRQFTGRQFTGRQFMDRGIADMDMAPQGTVAAEFRSVLVGGSTSAGRVATNQSAVGKLFARNLEMTMV